MTSLTTRLAVAAAVTIAAIGAATAQDFDPAAVARDTRTAIGETLSPDTLDLMTLIEETEAAAGEARQPVIRSRGVYCLKQCSRCH